MYVCFLVPTTPMSLTIVNTTDSTVTLSWMPPDPPNGIITQYELQYRIAGSSSGYTSLVTTDLTRTITGLDNNTEYEFRVRARTTVGYGNFSIIATNHSKLVITCIISAEISPANNSIFKFTSSGCPS